MATHLMRRKITRRIPRHELFGIDGVSRLHVSELLLTLMLHVDCLLIERLHFNVDAVSESSSSRRLNILLIEILAQCWQPRVWVVMYLVLMTPADCLL